MKRLLDIVMAAAIIIVLSPFWLAAIVALLLSNPREIFFRQARVGRDGKLFKVYKFVTIRESPSVSGPLVSSDEDPRITRVGKTLRAIGLNELPQLINVLRGEMSLVGPRPSVSRYVDLWPEESKRRLLSVRPGITGMATVKFWNEAAMLSGKPDVEDYYIRFIMPRKIVMEEWYLANWSILLDIRILVTTLFLAFGGARFRRRGS